MRRAWLFGAAAASLLVVVLVWTKFANSLPTTEHLGASETAEGIDVPVIGTVGDFPEPEHRMVVNVTADGRIVLDGETLVCDALFAELWHRGDALRGDLLPGTRPPKYLSNARVVLRVDGGLPWGSTQQLLQVCAESCIWRIWFAVRCEDGGADGALGLELPKDKGCEDPKDLAWKRIRVAPGEGGTPAALFAELSQSPAYLSGKLATELSIDPRLPTRVALALIDTVIRAGAARVELALTHPPPDCYRSFAAEVASLRSTDGAYSLHINGNPPGDTPAARPMPPASRVGRTVLIPGLGVVEYQEPAAAAADKEPDDVRRPSPWPSRADHR